MPFAMAAKASDDNFKTSDSCKNVAEKSMNEAANEIHDLSEASNSVVDMSISTDGSWQKRGYSSAFSMEPGKILHLR